MRKIIGLTLSLFLILGQGNTALALQVMYPHIAKEAGASIPDPVKPRIKRVILPERRPYSTHTLRSPSSTEVENEAELYRKAKQLEGEMLSQLGRSRAYRTKQQAPAKKRVTPIKKRRVTKIEHRRRGVNAEAERAARIARAARQKELRKEDKRLAKEARYAPKESDYIFDPRNFMIGLLGERVGLGHAYLAQERPGTERYYQESDGFRLVRMFDWIDGIDSIDFIGIAGRVELEEKPFPLESLILDAKKIDIITLPTYQSRPGVTKGAGWQTREEYRSQILPLFTKSTAIDTYITYGNLPKFTFTYDYREIYHQYQALYGNKDWDIKTFEFRLEDARKWYPIGYVSFLPGYKYQIYDSESAYSGNESSANEHRDVYYLDILWAPSGTLEFYTKIDGHKSNYSDITYKYSPWHWGVRGEARKKYLPWQLSATLGYAHSFDKYSPFENFFRKEEIYLDIGKDITGRLKASSRWEWIYAEITEDDNQAPTYATFNPYQADAKVLNVKNQFQYQLLKNLYVKGGFDTATAFGFDEFNNFGVWGEVEFYNAGYFRTNFGYRHTNYFHLEDQLNTIYFRCFMFM